MEILSLKANGIGFQVYHKIDFLNLMRASCHYSLFYGVYPEQVASRKIISKMTKIEETQS